MKEPKQILKRLGLTDSEVVVYLAMLQGFVTPREIMKTTSRKRPTVYYALACLEKRGLVSKTGREGRGRFAVEPLERLQTISEEQAQSANDLVAQVKGILPALTSQSSSQDGTPSVAFFEGAEAVRNVVMGSLYCRSKSIDVVAPDHNFFREMGDEFLEKYVGLRKNYRIKTRSLWEQSIEPALRRKYYEGLSEIRIVPSVMKGKFSTTIFLYDNKTMYVSSLKNCYCIVITSKEHHDTMKAWFDGLWEHSKKHPS
jgi:predicted transcriptional regulator